MRTDNAKKENDVVYHERITKKEELAMPKILPQVESTVKPIGFDPCDYSISGEDLFKALLPTNVIKAVSLYSEEKAKFRRNVIDKVEKKDGDLEYVNSQAFFVTALFQRIPAVAAARPGEFRSADGSTTFAR